MFKKVRHVHTSETRGCTKGFVCIFIEKATQVKRATMTSKLKFVNSSAQTDDKIYAGCHDVAILTENMSREKTL